VQFRKDINGLRAIAVIAVVLFHFNSAWMPGGFAGVDVFFVISGYLMTGIIISAIEKNSFSILNFYIARANRIIPALALLCLVLLSTLIFFLSPSEYQLLASHVASSISFLSNFVYWSESGYFDAASHEKWLLHTWSLSAEWQFYIIYPLILIMLRKLFTLGLIKIILVTTTGLGFIFGILASSRWPDSSYFLLHTRAWEMMFGGIAFLYPISFSDRYKKVIECAGIVLILIAYIFITKYNSWPGYLAALPVFGSFLIIQANRGDSLVTGNFIFQKIGAWSYSIYLWHWPIVVAISYFNFGGEFVYLGIGLSVLLGYLSNRFIEKIKFRTTFKSPASYFTSKPLYISLLLCIFGFFAYHNTNLLYRLPATVYSGVTLDENTDDNGEYTWELHKKLNRVISFEEDKTKVLIIGDSQAGDFLNILYESNRLDNLSVISRIVYTRCRSVLLENKLFEKMLTENSYELSTSDTLNCLKSTENILNSTLLAEADFVILSMNWYDEYLPFALESIKNVREINPNSKLIIVSGKSFTQKVPLMYFQAYKNEISLNNFAAGKVSEEKGIHYSYQHNYFSKFALEFDYSYLNLLDIICTSEECRVSDSNDQLFYYDKTHLTELGASHFGDSIEIKTIFSSDI
jgi:peptidoglycan/LPS O-acetylase OafA/YrhL